MKLYRDFNWGLIPGEDLSNAKILLTCGKTGMGKSMFINWFYNYFSGVKLGDFFRLTLTNDELNNEVSYHSVTQQVTAFVIRGQDRKAKYVLIDTPGYADTNGV